ncbi:LysM peptidoglycan-binding domain-containing protein [Pseudocolwellia agarivorans]|uniref:LysM peptidoglycan-binding domain-containing protein n=1 Tax=Pseudocolwellia agarivorans TaxID=1911682 RepID=UPI0009874245|nr:LysM peptidoglycan-binding domain-containing protein [Pseudocolwellia agarivorans]
MKYISLSLALSIVLVGCQSTPFSQQAKQTNNPKLTPENTAKPSDIHRLLVLGIQEESIAPLPKIAKGTPVEYSNVWERIKNNLVLDIPIHENVISHRNTYLKHPTALNNLLKRSEPFLYYIIEKLEENNIPLEIALLPLVESAFSPYARSSVDASGLWQFVPATGKQFGLKQNWWYDGRRDVIASTDGAVEYLKYLHKFFDGDWMLALAAYNSGEGRVQRAMKKNIRKNRPTHYWELELPKETRDYVPKLLAIIDIIQHAQEYKIDLYPIENKQVVNTVKVESQIDLSVAAHLAGLPLDKFKELNPGFNQWATDPNHSTSFLLPNENIASFNDKLAKLPKKDHMVWQRYQIKQGDSLGKIAHKFHLDINSIRTINKLSGNNIRAGKHLLIPVAAKDSSSSQQYTLTEQVQLTDSQPTETKQIHVVSAGDTLWDISKAYKVSTKEIAKWNNISTQSTLKLGQKLVVWNASITPKSKSITYKVRRGDSFARIANKFKVSIKSIEKWNNLTRKEYLQPGQKLKIDVSSNG